MGKTKQELVKNIKISEAIDNWKRAVADYQNLEKRAREEKISFIKTANRELIIRLLPVLDTLVLASTHIKNEGLELAIKQFTDLLKNEGVERIETEEKEFDPRIMECAQTVLGEENKVISEVRTGYTLHDTVLRPAQVRVGKKVVKEEHLSMSS